ncbi:BRO-N domain-containing protein [Levilactobacillus brevis]|uniref:BRO-N domain-containing protein n=1 Tax=Levilactobacillus brevis TaxID=1580 RepID=UPI0020323DF2|nr:BRO family protein [Levilactobacillus brevis]
MHEMTPFNFEGNQVRTVMIDDEPYFVGKDAALAIGYKNTRKAIHDHVKPKYQREERIVTPSGIQTMTVISEPGIYQLAGQSKLPSAEPFQDWIYEDVLPSIRKTGTYSTDNTLTAQRTKRLEIMEANKQTRKATALYDIAMEVSDERAKQNMLREAAKLIIGHDIESPSYTATYIGEALGVSKELVGRIANQLNIKAPEGGANKYGYWVIRRTDAGTYPQWLYTDDGASEVATELRARIEQTA